MALLPHLLQTRRRLHTSIEQQQALLADDIQHARLNAAQLRRSIVHTATSPMSLGIVALIGFFSARKLQSPRVAREREAAPEHPQPPRQSTLVPLLINLMTPTLIGLVADRLLPLISRHEVHRNEARRDNAPAEPSAPEPWR